MIAPLAGLTIVFNIIFSHYLLKEKVYNSDLIGCGIISLYI